MNIKEQQLKTILDSIPDPKIDLDATDPFQLLIQVILSAQTTDVQVNKVSPFLFQKYPNMESLAMANLNDVEKIIKSLSFFRNKAKNIILCSQQLINDYNKTIPNTLENLTKLAGVGDKTASVILVCVYGKPAIVVDTHVSRVARRLEWSQEKQPIKIKRDLESLIDSDLQVKAGEALVLFGRYVCKAKKPLCNKCPVNNLCPSKSNN